MYNYEQQMPVYGQPVEFLYARGLQPGVNMQPGIGGFVSGVRQTMQNINGMAPMHRTQAPYVQQPVMAPQIMHVDEGERIYLAGKLREKGEPANCCREEFAIFLEILECQLIAFDFKMSFEVI